MNTDDFTPHLAGPCPVAPDAEVVALFPDGETIGPHPAGFFAENQDWWQHKGVPHCHIVGFMVVEDA